MFSRGFYILVNMALLLGATPLLDYFIDKLLLVLPTEEVAVRHTQHDEEEDEKEEEGS